MYLDPSVSDQIALGAGNGAYMGARPVFGTEIPEPASMVPMGIGMMMLMVRHPRQEN
jgi:hypothetical protein